MPDLTSLAIVPPAQSPNAKQGMMMLRGEDPVMGSHSSLILKRKMNKSANQNPGMETPSSAITTVI